MSKYIIQQVSKEAVQRFPWGSHGKTQGSRGQP